jgi:copper chaperone CopZ
MKTVQFSITDMHCPACVMRLESLEDDLPGVQQVSGSYQRQRLDVVYDEGEVSEAEIRAAIAELGYTAG